jgi:hypothetical protein
LGAPGQKGTNGDGDVDQIAPQAYDMRSFCTAYGISRSFAYVEIKAGRLKTLKAGRRTLISRQAADDWLNSLDCGVGQAPGKSRRPSSLPPAKPSSKTGHD